MGTRNGNAVHSVRVTGSERKMSGNTGKLAVRRGGGGGGGMVVGGGGGGEKQGRRGRTEGRDHMEFHSPTARG